MNQSLREQTQAATDFNAVEFDEASFCAGLRLKLPMAEYSGGSNMMKKFYGRIILTAALSAMPGATNAGCGLRSSGHRPYWQRAHG